MRQVDEEVRMSRVRDAHTKGGYVVTPELIREAVDAILSMMEWARHVSNAYLDGDPQARRDLVKDMQAAKEIIRRLNAEISNGAK